MGLLLTRARSEAIYMRSYLLGGSDGTNTMMITPDVINWATTGC